MITTTTSDLFSKIQNHVYLEFERIKTFQTPHRGV